MPRYQCKNTINNIRGNIEPPEPSYPTTARTEHSSTAEAQENDLKTNLYEEGRGPQREK